MFESKILLLICSLQSIWLLQAYLLKVIILFNLCYRSYLGCHSNFILLHQFWCNIKVNNFLLLLLLLLRNSWITWIFKDSCFQLNSICWQRLRCINCTRFGIWLFPNLVLRVQQTKNHALTEAILVLRSFSRPINC